MMTGLVIILLALLAGYLVHIDRRFAGSAFGNALGIAGALLMLVPLAYVPIKRIARVRTAVKRKLPMPKLLQLHIVAGLVGPVLAVLHTGHRFDSQVGIALVAATVLIPLSGYVGYHIRTRLLAAERALTTDANRLRADLAGAVNNAASGRSATARHRARQVAESLADIEIARGTRRGLRRAFGVWHWLHVLASGVLYALLAIHVWAALRFGLRWWGP